MRISCPDQAELSRYTKKMSLGWFYKCASFSVYNHQTEFWNELLTKRSNCQIFFQTQIYNFCKEKALNLSRRRESLATNGLDLRQSSRSIRLFLIFWMITSGHIICVCFRQRDPLKGDSKTTTQTNINMPHQPSFL